MEWIHSLRGVKRAEPRHHDDQQEEGRLLLRWWAPRPGWSRAGHGRIHAPPCDVHVRLRADPGVPGALIRAAFSQRTSSAADSPQGTWTARPADCRTRGASLLVRNTAIVVLPQATGSWDRAVAPRVGAWASPAFSHSRQGPWWTRAALLHIVCQCAADCAPSEMVGGLLTAESVSAARLCSGPVARKAVMRGAAAVTDSVSGCLGAAEIGNFYYGPGHPMKPHREFPSPDRATTACCRCHGAFVFSRTRPLFGGGISRRR